MHKFPLVQNLDRLNPVDFQDPEARVNPEDVVGRIETGDALSGMLLSEAEAGRPVVLSVLAVRRLDGVFIIAGALVPTPVNPVHRADTSAPVKAAGAEFVPIKAEVSTTEPANKKTADDEKSPAGNSTDPK